MVPVTPVTDERFSSQCRDDRLQTKWDHRDRASLQEGVALKSTTLRVLAVNVAVSRLMAT